MKRWDQQFFDSTRGQIVNLLRRTRQTVEDLAAALALTDNAVRAHLLRLERDGLVRQRGVRRGERRPSLVYELTPDAEQLFSRAYAPTLRKLLEVLEERRPRRELHQLAREAGRRLARDDNRAATGLESAARALNALGGLAEVQTSADGSLELRGFACPLGELVHEHPELCALAEGLVSEVSGQEMRERCARTEGEPPSCRFVVAADR